MKVPQPERSPAPTVPNSATTVAIECDVSVIDLPHGFWSGQRFKTEIRCMLSKLLPGKDSLPSLKMFGRHDQRISTAPQPVEMRWSCRPNIFTEGSEILPGSE
jgi:hypothetical protein